jgi:hypothetical protein
MLGVVLCSTIALNGIIIKIKQRKKTLLPLQPPMLQVFTGNVRTLGALTTGKLEGDRHSRAYFSMGTQL